MIKKFFTNLTYETILKSYIFILIVFTTISFINDNTVGIYLSLAYIVILGIIEYIIIRMSNRIDTANIRLNYMNVYKKIPDDLKHISDKKSKKLYVYRVQKSYPHLKSPHDVLVYISIYPGTELTKYFIKNFDKLTISFFKDKFIVILENNDLAVCKPHSL